MAQRSVAQGSILEPRTRFPPASGQRLQGLQSRLVELIDQVDDDKLTADLLEVNDNMNNIFLRWERL